MTEQFRPELTPPSEPTLTLGEQLKSYRRNNRLSQIGLARLVGVSPSAICHWEKDRGFPSQRRLRAVQEVLGLPSEDKDSLNNALDNTRSSRYNYLTISMQLENSRFPLITQIPGKFDENDLARIGTIVTRMVDAYLSYKETIARIVRESFEPRPSSDEPTLYG